MTKEQKEELKVLKAMGKKKCLHCMTEIDLKAKVCPNCRKKQKKGGCLINFIVGIIVLGILSSFISSINSQVHEMRTSVSEQYANMSETEFKNACAEIEYKDLFRNIEENKGKLFKFRGKIIQVVNDGTDSAEFRIEITEGEYIWEDAIYVYLSKKNTTTKFLENDIVEFYGECKGSYTYTSILGQSIETPKLVALYMELDK